jgi:pimeloyl-ACP methyl ester carboxylesterase
MGAAVSLALALRHPAKVRALILLRPAWLHEGSPPPLALFPKVAEFIEAYGRWEGKEQFRRYAPLQALAQECPACAESLLRQFDYPQPQAVVDRLQQIPASHPYDNPAELQALDLPCLVLGSRQDPFHPFSYAEALAAGIPGAQLQEVPSRYRDEAAHLAAVRKAIGDFLRDK